MHQWGTRPVSPRRNPEEPWDVTLTTSSLTRRTYWCAPSACEEDLEFQDRASRLEDMLTVSETLSAPGGMGHGFRGTLPLRRLVRCWLHFRQCCRAFSTTATA